MSEAAGGAAPSSPPHSGLNEAAANPVHDDERLWRRVHRNHYVSDGQGGMKVSSGAFSDTDLSVDRAHIVEMMGHGTEFTRTQGGWRDNAVGVAQFLASVPRSRDLVVDPSPLDANPAHCEIGGNKTDSVKKFLSRNCEFLG